MPSMTTAETEAHTTLNDHRPVAVVCRERGWTAGTRLVGEDCAGVQVIEITAVGERLMLAKTITLRGKPVSWPSEGLWTLACRDWREAT